MSRKDMLRYVFMLHVTMILANILLITLSPVPRGILGLLLMGVCCFMMYREGEGMGERACSMKSSISHMDRPADKAAQDNAYNPKAALKGVVVCAIVPLVISLMYFAAYGLSIKTEGGIYGQDMVGSEDEEGESLEELLMQATVSMTEDGEIALNTENLPEIEPMTTLDKVVFGLRVTTTVLAIPYWSAVAIWQSQYVLLTALGVVLLVVYPFVWPFMMYLGYLQGPKLWVHTEEAMAKGRRRAKARSRIFRKNNRGPREQKPLI